MTGNPSSARLGYVPAIDGLRAVAVVSVILFHLWPGLLPGGFAGVDIFFVISGFVVTGSIMGRRFETLRGLLAYFYARRLMRIMPALLVMLLATIVASDLFIPDSWLSRAAPLSGIAAFFGLSNVALAIDTDTYFGPQAAYNPLTHSWSLGVEEQFYLLFPFLIHWHQRLKGEAISERRKVWLVTALTLASLAIAAALSGLTRSLAFYLIFPRFWELGAGMLLCLTAEAWQPRVASLGRAGHAALLTISAALVAAGLAIPESDWFPFPLALLPVLGTAGLIAVVRARPASPTTLLLQARLIVAVGRLSYSLYLWHWPVFTLFRWTVGLEDLRFALAALVIACLLAALSYRFVEQPLRTSPAIAAMPRPRVVRGALAAVLVSALAGAGLIAAHDRLSLSVTRDHAAWYAEGERPLDPARNHCRVREHVEGFHGGKMTVWTPEGCAAPAGFALFAIGDSHNLAYAPNYRQLAAELGVPVRAWFRTGCPFAKLNDAVARRGGCDSYENALIGAVRAQARAGDVIFLPGLRLIRLTNQFERDGAITGAAPETVSPQSLDAARAVVARLAESGAHLLIEAPKPIFPSPSFRCSDWFNRANPICRGLTMPRAELEARRRPVLDAMSRLAEEQPALAVWDPFPLLCPGATCEAMPGGRPLFFDGDHLSGYGNDFVYPSWRAAVLKAAGRGITTAAPGPIRP